MTPAAASVLRAAVRWYQRGGHFALAKHLKPLGFYTEDETSLARAVERLKAEKRKRAGKGRARR